MDPPEQVGRPEVFRGNFGECLEHLSRCHEAHFPKGKKAREQVLQPIADFCGAHIGTVARWLNKEAMPVGDLRIKLMCCLDLLGYRVSEMEKMKSMRQFAELIGYGILNVEQARKCLQYANPQDVYAVLLYKQGLPNLRLQLMYTACRENRIELQHKKAQALQKCVLSFPLTVSVSQHEIVAVISVMDGLQALLDSPTVGAMFRTHMQNPPPSDSRTIMRLSTTLADLASCLAAQKGGNDG